jgi:D-methionine transport system substrate-binding protein
VAEAYNSAAFKAYAAKRFVGYKYPEGWQGAVPATERPASQT